MALTMKTSQRSLRKKWYAADDARSKSRDSMAELTVSAAMLSLWNNHFSAMLSWPVGYGYAVSWRD